MKKLLSFLLVASLFSSFLYAEKIDRYDINITIEQSGELSVTEQIDYNFGEHQKHGIYRDIPFQIKRKGVVKDIGLYDFSVMMDNGLVIWETQHYKSMHAGEVIRLKAGNPTSYVSGVHRYIIHYRVKMGVLPAAQDENDDAVRWNIIGTGWDVPIENIQALFTLPDSLDQETVSLTTYTGQYGMETSSAQTEWVTPRLLKVTVKRLEPYEGATVELAFPAGMLGQNGLENVEPTLWELLLAQWHWLALAVYLFYFNEVRKKYIGFEDKRAVAVQYLPPQGLSLLQSGLLLDKYADNKDFAAAVVELAQLGYLEINKAGKYADPVLIRLEKPDEGLTLDQKYLLDNILFYKQDYFVMKRATEASARKLKSGFDFINNNLYTWSVREGYMKENPKKTRKHFLVKNLLIMLPVIIMTFYTLLQQFGLDAVFIFVFPIVFGSVGVAVFFSKYTISQKLAGLVFAATGLIPLLSLPQQYGVSLLSILAGPFGVLIAILYSFYHIYSRIGKFTQKGAYAHKKLMGLQEFIRRVKKDEIRRRLALDPLYLEKLLPYAMLFGESKHWLSFFKLLQVSTPAWYNGDIDDLGNFADFMDKTATPPAQSSAGGGFSGMGGFSGGGGGGGGGGSW